MGKFLFPSILLWWCLACTAAIAQTPSSIPGLLGHTTVVYDKNNVPTIFVENELDGIFMQGYLHAQDRFFQMDHHRRMWSGTLAEMLGPVSLPQDIELRTLGLRRAAELSLPMQSPATLAWLQAYSKGVNAYLEDDSKPLPPEYAALELTRNSIPPWNAIDSLTISKGLFFAGSFAFPEIDLSTQAIEYSQAGATKGFDGLALLFDDVFRTAPFDPTVSIPPPDPHTVVNPAPAIESLPDYLNNNTHHILENYRNKIAGIPVLQEALKLPGNSDTGNWWLASGAISETGYPLFANDPHSTLGTPASFYEVHLIVEGKLNVTGVSFPGVPGVILGCNEAICWGATVNPMDVTDVYLEEVFIDPFSGIPLTTTFKGVPELLVLLPQTFQQNVIGDNVSDNLVDAGVGPRDGGVTLVVPRRNNGPIVQYDATQSPAIAISVQYTGWSGTREVETFRQFARAANINDFIHALQYFDVGSQNWSYADVGGNIAYFTSAEMPIREDLQNLGSPDGIIPPYLIRDGTNTLPHEWLQVTNPQPGQSLDFEILPFGEMPQVVNPPSGYILNASNDPFGSTLDNHSFNQVRHGGGLYYLNSGYATGFRIGRIQRLFDEALAGNAKLSADQVKAFQANNQLLDAEVLAPYLLAAFANASTGGAPAELAAQASDPGVAEAITRLQAWDFSTPTGIPEGYDPGDDPDNLPVPSAAEIQNSVAASIYSTWRGQLVYRVIGDTLTPVGLDPHMIGSAHTMTALRNLLDNFPANKGFGASGLNFFSVPGLENPAVRRDLILLQSLRSALDLLASDEFAPAFGNSTEQNDYRWGKLHRIEFDHPLGDPFTIPPADGLSDLSTGLPGVARSGGMGTVDAASHSAHAEGLNDFMFRTGPARRIVASLIPDGPEVEQVIPGGQSGVLTNPPTSTQRSQVTASSAVERIPHDPGTLADSSFRTDQLKLWLGNEYHPLPVDIDGVLALAVKEDVFKFSAKPKMLRASDGTFSNRVEVTWQPVGGTHVYRVFRCLTAGQTCGSPIGFPKMNSFNDTKATPGTVFFYRVRACTKNECGKFSAANTGFKASTLDRPTGVRASDGTFNDRVQVSWNSVTGTFVYRVFRCMTTGLTCGSAIGFPKTTSFNDTKGAPGTEYYYRVKACTKTKCSKFSFSNAGHRSGS